MSALNNENILVLEIQHLKLKGLMGCAHVEINATFQKFLPGAIVCN